MLKRTLQLCYFQNVNNTASNTQNMSYYFGHLLFWTQHDSIKTKYIG